MPPGERQMSGLPEQGVKGTDTYYWVSSASKHPCFRGLRRQGTHEFGFIIYVIVQRMWSSIAILIVMEACLVIVCFGAGLIQGILEMAQESFSALMIS